MHERRANGVKNDVFSKLVQWLTLQREGSTGQARPRDIVTAKSVTGARPRPRVGRGDGLSDATHFRFELKP